MYNAIFYKEWTKLRWLLLVLLIITLALHAKIFIMLRSAIISKGAYHLWYMAAIKQTVFYGDIRWLVPFTGLAIGLAQFVPETGKRRLRILFHLPLPHNNSLSMMLGVGAVSVLLLCFFNLFLLFLTMNHFFPSQLVVSALWTGLAFPEPFSVPI